MYVAIMTWRGYRASRNIVIKRLPFMPFHIIIAVIIINNSRKRRIL